MYLKGKCFHFYITAAVSYIPLCKPPYVALTHWTELTDEFATFTN